jgi:hypothetical protein
MNNVCKILPLILAAVACTVIELNTDRNGEMRISYRVLGDAGGPYTAMLLQERDAAALQTFRRIDSGLNITSVDNEHVITPGVSYRIPRINEMFIAIGFNSRFAADVAHQYMLIPKNRQLVINPPNPREFVYEGELVTTRSTSDDHLQVRVSVSFLNRPQGDSLVPRSEPMQIHEFGLSFHSDKDFVPASILQALYDELHRRGIDCDRGRGGDGSLMGFHISGDLTDEVIDRFPIIQYRIHTDSGNDVAIELDGKDYLGPLEGDTREVLLFSDGDFCLGFNTLSKIALFVDNRNRTIGFGEPL